MLAIGTRLGPYQILAPLGRGGMGEVYRPRDLRLDREVAVKVVPEQLAQDPDRLARFEREARAVAALAHPNILVLYDVGREQGVPFAVTELLEGVTLRDRLAAAPLPWREALQVVCASAARSHRTGEWPVGVNLGPAHKPEAPAKERRHPSLALQACVARKVGTRPAFSRWVLVVAAFRRPDPRKQLSPSCGQSSAP
jgi:aminoglycoside phosphotransferase (APT) family kinase protein